MLIAFSYYRGVAHKKFVPQGQTINQNVYKGPLQLLHDSIRRRQPELSAAEKWFLEYENARPHMALFVKDFLSVHQITVLPHAPYSPDLSPCHFFSLSIKRPSVWIHSGHLDSRHNTAQQHSRECFPGLLQRYTETLEAACCCRRKLLRRMSLAPEYKYIVLILIPSVLKLSGHRVYDHKFFLHNALF